MKINISEWKDISFGELLDVEIDRGLEMKILYNPAEDPNKVVRCYFCTSPINCRHFELQLGSGLYEYHGCPSGNLDLPEVKENKPWIVKIYRREAWLMMDLDGVNRLKLDTTVGSCSEFWKTGHISKMTFNEVSQDVVTHYRIAARQDVEEEDESQDEEDEDDDKDEDDDEDEEEDDKDKDDDEDEEEEDKDKDDDEDEEEDDKDKDDDEDEEEDDKDKEDDEDEEEEDKDKDDDEDEEEEDKDKDDDEDEEEDDKDKDDDKDEEEEDKDKDDDEDEEEEDKDKDDDEDEEEEDKDKEDTEDGNNDFTGKIRMLSLVLPGDPRLLCSLTKEIWRNDRLSAAQ